MIVSHGTGLGAALRVGVALRALGLPAVDERLDGQPVVGAADHLLRAMPEAAVVRPYFAISASSRPIKSQSGWP